MPAYTVSLYQPNGQVQKSIQLTKPNDDDVMALLGPRAQQINAWTIHESRPVEVFWQMQFNHEGKINPIAGFMFITDMWRYLSPMRPNMMNLIRGPILMVETMRHVTLSDLVANQPESEAK